MPWSVDEIRIGPGGGSQSLTVDTLARLQGDGHRHVASFDLNYRRAAVVVLVYKRELLRTVL